MTRQIIFHGDYFLDFYQSLDAKVKTKIQYVLELIKQVERVPVKFLAPMSGYEGLYEVRVEYQSNIYRIFCCFDEGRLVVLFNGFQKKTQKTPKEELEKAMRLKSEYFKFKGK
ncbi:MULTISPECIES: type II toxin-antitoxin system RelE/ParE family toxin [Pontibacter]|uniref:Type II toxin-antitoxin system RelE/ParE family toxin n=2 Tax=Pontibacter TaxID=323449 RepID=A0A6B2H989_9BACT|nr:MULTISPECIES: type II toxin-antitoxin system RelE/ParE family toxin [Pontibacter]NDK57746.1 type II toxin-antitoxin system RelE/ParE family toxin [Pontibacter fetidus]PKV62397.1 phage-related protein [Pontibacter ramchanderi]